MEKRKTVNVSIDIETTGFQAGVHEIISFSFIEFNKEFEVLNIFTTKIKPMRPELANAEALQINKLSLADLKNAPTPPQIKNAFFQWHEEVLESKIICPLGHNFIFDNSFLKIFFYPHYSNIFDYHYDDTVVLARALKRKGKIPAEQSCKLTELCKYFNINNSGAHDSHHDALVTIKVFKKLISLMG